MRGKGGQVALFVIVALLIVVAAVIVVLQRDKIIDTFNQAARKEISSIDGNIRDCLKETAQDGIYAIGLQGGWPFPSENSFETNISKIAFAYYEGKNTLPSIETMQNQLSIYVKTFLPACANFTKFADFDVAEGSLSVKSQIRQDYVLLNISWPITIIKGEKKWQLEKYDVKIPVRLGLIYNITDTIVKKEIADPGRIDLGYFIDVYKNTGIYIDILPYNLTIVYSLRDPAHANELGSNYTFLFANQFEG
jgi:hypothetical protein